MVIDADAITREVQEPGDAGASTPWSSGSGPGIVGADGTLDRQAVADIVFPDPDALADLNAIVHPAVGAEIAEPPGRAGGHRPRGDPRRAAAGRERS